MTPHGLLEELVLVYGVAIILLLVGSRLRVPSIVSLISAGVIAGPNGIGLMTSQEDVDLLSEIGVALLLFTAGLEFSLTEVRKIWRTILPGGLAQVVLTGGAIGAVVAVVSSGSLTQVAVIGLFVALSSTAVVLKELARRNQLHSPAGRLTIGVLLLQDIVVIAILATAPALLGQQGATESSGILRALVRLSAVAVGVALLGTVLLPRLLRIAAAISREAFSLAVLIASVGTAVLASVGGLSMAAGSFLAGLILADGEYSHQVHADVRPLRDMLASLFFVSVGMLVDLRHLVPVLPLVIAGALVIMLAKGSVAFGALALTGSPARIALVSALALSQVGEFSFVLGSAALDSGVITADVWQVLLGASIVTMALTPSVVALAPAVAARLIRRSPVSQSLGDQRAALRDHVVILGYGMGGQLLTHSLTELSVPHVVLELNGSTVRHALARGVNIHYADVSAPEPLEAAGVERAAAVVAVLSDPDATERSVRAVRALAPDVPLIVRTRYRLEADRLAQAGATLVITEELEASLEVLAQLLARLHMPGNLVETLVDRYRQAVGGSMARTARAPAIPLEELPREIAGAPVSTLRLIDGAWGSGRTLQELDLRNSTGATVLAVRRQTGTTTSPPGTFRLEPGDDIFLLGDGSDVLLARTLLTDGPRSQGA